MSMYATKVWGFASAQWPVITFSRQGVRDRLKLKWKPGDTMLLIGTQTKDTHENDRGRVLGYVTFTETAVMTREVVEAKLIEKNGDKWPYALLCRDTYRLQYPPLFKTLLPEVHARCPGMMLATNYTELSPEEEARVRALPAIHETLTPNEAGQKAVDQTNMRAGIKGNGRGPVTFSGSYRVERVSRPAMTYLLKRDDSDLMKIGWAYDPAKRARSLSQPLVPKFTNEAWTPLHICRWDDEYSAYFMEQTVINLLDAYEIEREGEYFRPPQKSSLVTSGIWTEAIQLTSNHIHRLSDDEMKQHVGELFEGILDAAFDHAG